MFSVMPLTPPPHRAETTPGVRPTRRALLRGGLLGAGAALLSGCSGGAPRPPWSPDPTDDPDAAPLPPDADVLLAARGRLQAYRTALGQVTAAGDDARRVGLLEDLWATQQDRIEQLVLLSGVQLPDDGAPAGATSSETDGQTTGPDAARATSGGGDPTLAPEHVAGLIRTDLDTAYEDIARTTQANRAVLVSLVAQHAHAARLLGDPPDRTSLEGPQGASAVPVLAATRPAVFGLEVVAARAGEPEEREEYEAVLEPVRALTRELTTLAGDAAPVAPLGYDLPEQLDDAEARTALALSLLGDVAPATLSVVDRAGSDVAQVRSLVRILAEASHWSRTLGAEPEPFPGMTLP